MDCIPHNSRFGLNNNNAHEDINTDSLLTCSGLCLNNNGQAPSTDFLITTNSGLCLNHHHIHQEFNRYNLTAYTGFDLNHYYIQEHKTNGTTVKSGFDLNHYIQEDNKEALEKKVPKRINGSRRLLLPPAFPKESIAPPKNQNRKTTTETKNKKEAADKVGIIALQTFTFHELALATKNFRLEFLLGEGGFGRVYKGRLKNDGKLVAIKQLDRNGLQGNREFLVEVLTLSLLHHQNLVSLVGYCADGDQRLLVYEYMQLGSLEDHLLHLAPDRKSLGWSTRMKIAVGAAKGLEYLHDKANPPIIHRDLKSSNILLDEEYNPKLSDFGLGKLGSVGDKPLVSLRVMGTHGYCAPEYARTHRLTLKSDVYSFGVVLLELITGRRAIDTTRPTEEQNLVSWARPFFKDLKRFPQIADPLLQRDFPIRRFIQAGSIAAMCLKEDATARPLIRDVVSALSFLAMAPTDEGRSVSFPILSSSSPDKLSNSDKEN